MIFVEWYGLRKGLCKMKTKTHSIKAKGIKKMQRKETNFVLLQVLESHDIL